MKTKVCFKCQRFFDSAFLYCPYCGNPLKEAVLSEEAREESEAAIKQSKETKQDTKEQLFCDLLPSPEKFFIDEFYKEIRKEFSSIQMKQTKTYVYFERKVDKEILEHYGYWFYFIKKDNVLQFRYREKPIASEEQKMIEITRSTTIDSVVDVIMKIIRKRLDLGNARKQTVINEQIEKKKLPPRSVPKSIILSGEGTDEKRLSAKRMDDKKNPEVWQIRKDFIPRDDD